MIWDARYPFSVASCASVWLRTPNSYICRREIPYLRAISSAEMPCGTRSYSSISSGGKGVPGDTAFDPIGTLLIDSTPPAIVMSQTPDWIRLAAKWSACWLDPHWRPAGGAGGGTGKPAVRHAVGPTFNDCSPTWLPPPKTTTLTCSGL